VTMCPISPQTVMSVTCQPSLAPAVPRGSVAPATCPFNQNDPGVALGENHRLNATAPYDYNWQFLQHFDTSFVIILVRDQFVIGMSFIHFF